MNIKKRFLHVICNSKVEWMASEMTSTECLSITPFTGYRWSHFPLSDIGWLWQQALNLHVRQTTNGPVHVKIGGDAWQFLHNTVSSLCDLWPLCMSFFHHLRKKNFTSPLWNKFDTKLIIFLSSSSSSSSSFKRVPCIRIFTLTATKLCQKNLIKFKNRESVQTGSCLVETHCS